MKLLHVLQSANPTGGGVFEAVNQFAAAHRRAGHTVDIASLDAPDSPWVSACPQPVRALGRGRRGYGYAPGFASWLHGVKEDYDAIIVNGIWQYSSFAVRYALRGSDTPYFAFPHGMLDPWFRRMYPLKHLKKTIYWWCAEYRILRDARLVLFTCEEERHLARQSFRPYRCREAVVNLGTAAPLDDPARQRAVFYSTVPGVEGKRLILFLGRLHEKKGCDLLIRAFARVRGESLSRGKQLHLVMAGPSGDSSYLAALKTLAASSFCGEEPPISWTGMLTGEIKWGAYRSADVFILPSHQENFGFSVVEALSCELPVLISNKVNIWREIYEDCAGRVEPDNLEGTTRLLQYWLSMGSGSRLEMRNAAHRCFRARFEIARTARHFIELVENAAYLRSAVSHDRRPKTLSVSGTRGQK